MRWFDGSGERFQDIIECLENGQNLKTSGAPGEARPFLVIR
jgi:hypothetical protein